MVKQVDYEFAECAAGLWHVVGRGQETEPRCIPHHRFRVTGCSPLTTEIKGEGSVNLKGGSILPRNQGQNSHHWVSDPFAKHLRKS